MTIDPRHLLQQLSRLPRVRRWWVAYSGGLDSHVLLHLAVAAGLRQSHDLRAVHINHGLQDQAGDWAAHCRRVCCDLQVPLTVIDVQVEAGASQEAAARDARYRAFEQLVDCDEGVLMAHHADDQAETVLLRLLRGSGVKGLAAMPEQRPLGAGLLFRPLLAFERRDLESWATGHQLNWINDPSNRSLDFDRNYLRHQVVPHLKQRWPHASSALSRTARFCREAEQLNRQLAAIDLLDCGIDGAIRCSELLVLEPARQLNLLRHWLAEAGVPLPEESVLRRVLTEVVPARQDAEPCVDWGDHQIRRFRGQLRLWNRNWQAPEGRRRWPLSTALTFSFGTLRSEAVAGRGIRIPAGASVEVDFRRGGERICLLGRAGSRSLKKLLQASDVPPWQRSLIPLIYVDGVLAAVVGLWIARGFEVKSSESGILLKWTPVF